MQLDGGWIFAGSAWPASCGQGSVELAALCSRPSTSLHYEWYSLLHGARCAVHRSSSCTYIGKRSGGTNFWNPMARVALGTGSPCERQWPDKALESFHRLRSNIFEVRVLFERAHAHEPAHIHSTALACCAQCTSCEAIVCARSVSVDSAAMETIGVISMAAVLALGPGTRN